MPSLLGGASSVPSLQRQQTLVEIDELAPFFSFAKRARKAEEKERERRAGSTVSLLQASRPVTVAPAGGNLRSWVSTSTRTLTLTVTRTLTPTLTVTLTLT